MRNLREVEYELEMTKREMAQIIIRQSDDDMQLNRLDRRREYLEAERLLILAKTV